MAGNALQDQNQVYTALFARGTLGTADVLGTAGVVAGAADPVTGAQYVYNLAPAGSLEIGSITVGDIDNIGTLKSGTITRLEGGTLGLITRVGNVGTLELGTVTLTNPTGTTVQFNNGTIDLLKAGTITRVEGGTIGLITRVGNVGTLEVGTLSAMPNIPGGTIGLVSSVGSVPGVGTLTNIGSITNIGMLHGGTVVTNVTMADIPGGTIDSITDIANLSKGTITRVEGGTITRVGNVGTLELGTVTLTNPTGTTVQFNNGTIDLLKSGTVTRLEGGTVNISHGGTTVGTANPFPVNIRWYGDSTVATGNGAAAAGGVARVAIANDNDPVAIKGTLNAGTITRLEGGTVTRVSTIGTLEVGTISSLPNIPGGTIGLISILATGTISALASGTISRLPINGTASGAMTDGNGVDIFTGYSNNTVAITIDGTWSGTIDAYSYFTSDDAAVFRQDLLRVQDNSLTKVSRITANGQYLVPSSGAWMVSFTPSFSSGTANYWSSNSLGNRFSTIMDALPTGGNTIGNIGTLTAGTLTRVGNLGTLELGTVRVNPRPTRDIITFGTTSAGTIGTILAAPGVGTSIYVESLEVSVHSGTVEPCVSFGLQANGQGVLTRGLYPALGGVQKTFSRGVNGGTTNSALTWNVLTSSGTVSYNIAYWVE